MRVFFKCVAESVVECGLHGLAQMIPGGAFAYEVAFGTWKKYRERCKSDQIREEIRQLAIANVNEAKQVAAEVARDVVRDSKDCQIDLELFLANIPGAVKQSLKRPDDPTGTTVPPTFAINSPDDVLRLLPARPPRLRPGNALPGRPGWILVDLLGAGGFGEVWLARNVHISSLVGAVKFCHALQVRDRGLLHESQVIERVMQRGKHANIVSLLDARLNGDPPWLMYEYIPGGDLTDLIWEWQGLQPAERIATSMAALRDLAEAVGSFHQLKPAIVHRDLKPSNILRDIRVGVLRVTDFGIGAVTAKAALMEESRGQTTQESRLLTYLRGSYTPVYASPQQRGGADPDPRDDVHALGVIGYQMLTGFISQGPGADFATDLQEAGCSLGLSTLLQCCVARKAERRPQHAGVMAAELSQILAGAPVAHEPTGEAELQAKNIARWEASAEPAGWVAGRNGQWDHEQWLGLIRTLRSSAYWPMDIAAIGGVLEKEKQKYLSQLQMGTDRSVRAEPTLRSVEHIVKSDKGQVASEVRIIGHSSLLYLWPLWAVTLSLGIYVWACSGLIVSTIIAMIVGSAFLAWWIVSVFIIDPRKYWLIVSREKIQYHQADTGEIVCFSSMNSVFHFERIGGYIRSLFVSLLLGFGTRRLIVLSGRGESVILQNVIGWWFSFRRVDKLFKGTQ